MVDYDVAAIGLDSPPAEAFKTAYRPAIAVKNNGSHPAAVTGYIQILNLDTGLQAFLSDVVLASLASGSTGAAQALEQWTPDAEGHYLAFGYVTTPHDSVPTNNNLPPTRFHVGPGTPPPPVTVPAHAPQHEDGGSDELVVEGLAGKLAEPQVPDDHASHHQVGGSDQINLDGLSGKAATPQTPDTHSNSAHVPLMATADQLSTHQSATTAHTAATNLANRETTGGDTGLLKADQLAKGTVADPTGDRYLRLDRFFHAPVPTGLICVWPAATSIPTGWAAEGAIPPPAITHIWIVRL